MHSRLSQQLLISNICSDKRECIPRQYGFTSLPISGLAQLFYWTSKQLLPISWFMVNRSLSGLTICVAMATAGVGCYGNWIVGYENALFRYCMATIIVGWLSWKFIKLHHLWILVAMVTSYWLVAVATGICFDYDSAQHDISPLIIHGHSDDRSGNMLGRNNNCQCCTVSPSKFKAGRQATLGINNYHYC